MGYEGMSAAAVYEAGVVTGIFSEWTPALVATAKAAAGERALDLACGTGAVTRAVSRALGPGGSVVATDVSGAMLEVARDTPLPEGAAPVEWVEASAVDLPLPDADFDLVLCQQGLQFFPDKQAAAHEMARVLRPGGRLGLSVWRGLDQNPVQRALNDVLIERLGIGIFEPPFSFGEPAQVEQLLNGAGLADVDPRTETRNASYASVAEFVEVMILAGRSIIPAFAELSDEQVADIERASVAKLEQMAPDYAVDGRFVFPMASLVVTAAKP